MSRNNIPPDLPPEVTVEFIADPTVDITVNETLDEPKSEINSGKNRKPNGHKTKVLSPKFGGPQPNAGRKPGQTSKYSYKTILEAVEATTGMSFSQALAEGYNNSILDGDTKLRFAYEKTILDKVIADRMHVTVDETAGVEAKMEAFQTALGQFQRRHPDLPVIDVVATPVDQPTASNTWTPKV
jgi:hypothetical protein